MPENKTVRRGATKKVYKYLSQHPNQNFYGDELATILDLRVNTVHGSLAYLAKKANQDGTRVFPEIVRVRSGCYRFDSTAPRSPASANLRGGADAPPVAKPAPPVPVVATPFTVPEPQRSAPVIEGELILLTIVAPGIAVNTDTGGVYKLEKIA